MTVKTFNLPDPGEGLTEADIVTWRVAPGDTVNINDIVVEIETAKSLVELPVPFAGVVSELLVAEGQTVEVGAPIISVDTAPGAGDAVGAPSGAVVPAPAEGATEPGMIGSPAPKVDPSVGGGADASEEVEQGKIGGTTATGRTAVLVGYGVKQTEAKRRPRKAGAPGVAPAPAYEGLPVKDPDEFVPHPDVALPDATSRTARASAPSAEAAPHSAAAAVANGGERVAVLAKPPVRKLAKDLGVDLASVAATGPNGTVSRADVEAAAAGSGSAQPAVPERRDYLSDEQPNAGPGWSAFTGPREERIPVKGVRKVTAAAMVSSAFTAPHVTEWVTVDVTGTVELVEKLKQDKEFRDVKISPMLVLAKALCVAVRRHPGINAVWDEAAQEIVVKHYVNLGIAAATPRGLLVPNIKDAHTKDLHQLAQELGELTGRAREGKTQPAEMSAGTITITNVGVFGVDAGTPIINPGESAIVAFGAIRKQPWVVTAADGTDELAIRHVTTLAVSFDHRLVDGELGSRFLSDLAALMQDPARALVWG